MYSLYVFTGYTDAASLVQRGVSLNGARVSNQE